MTTTIPKISKAYYKTGYKYQLDQPFEIDTGIYGHAIIGDFLVLTERGLLGIFPGYAWNGANVVPDERCVIRGSLAHDALYQLMQEGLMTADHKDHADRLFQNMIVEDGMSRWRAWLYYHAVKRYGKTEKRPEIVEEAP